MVPAAEQRGTYKLRAVQDRRPQDTEGWLDVTVADHHNDTVLTLAHGGLLRHHLRDVMLGRLVVFHLSLLLVRFICLDPRSVSVIVHETSSSNDRLRGPFM